MKWCGNMLTKKMFRDIKLNLSQFITILLMTMIGILAYTGIKSYMTGMKESADVFYTEYNLQDLNVYGMLNNEDVSAIKKLDNVSDAEGKLSVTGSTSNDKTLLLNFINSNNISRFYLVEGISFNKDISGIWLDSFYADLNDISVGDILTIKYDNYTFKEEVKGLINVADHLYDVKDESELYPNHQDFGFAYLSTKELEGYIKDKTMSNLNIDEKALTKMKFNYEDYLEYNYIMVDVLAEENKSSVKENIEERVENALTVIDIVDTLSYSTYQGEIDEGKTYIGIFSGLFIFIAMLSVITTMSRVVRKQRIQIGTLKALGFKNTKIYLHYISYGFYISIIGVIIGLIIGYYGLGKLFINLEMSFFELPNGHPSITSDCFIMAILVVILVSIITYLSTLSILKKSPADTLRVEAPKVNSKSLNITTKGIFKKLNFNYIWNIRDILRNKMRTLTGIIGICGCCVLIVCALGMLDSLNHFVDLQFNTLFNFDYKLSINDNISKEDLEALTNSYGNNTSMSYLIEIIDKDNNKISNNVFIDDSNNMVRYVDKKNNFISLDNNDGIYITEKLASTLDISLGDTLKWHLIGNDTIYESKIVGLNKDPQNQNITITKEYFEYLGNTYTPDSLYTNVDLENITKINNVSLIQGIDSLKTSMNNMLSTMKSMISLIIVIAIILGVVIIYNMGILSFFEKQYQFATLKVLGFQDRVIKNIFIKQNNIITWISIILGLPLGYLLIDYLFKEAIADKYDFNAYVYPKTYILAIIGTYLVSYIVSLYLARKIDKIDMVTSLKGNE